MAIQKLNYNPRIGGVIENAPQFKGINNALRMLFSPPKVMFTKYTTQVEQPRTFPLQVGPIQLNEVINTQQEVFDYIAMTFGWYGGGVSEPTFLPEAMNPTGGGMIDPALYAMQNLDHALGRYFLTLFMQSWNLPRNRRPVQVSEGQAAYITENFPTTNIITNYQNSVVDTQFETRLIDFFLNTGLSDGDEGDINMFIPYSLYDRLWRAFASTFSSGIMAPQIMDGVFTPEMSAYKMFKTPYGTTLCMIPDSYFQKAGSGANQYWILPFWKRRAYCMSLDMNISQSWVYQDRWDNPRADAVGRMFGMCRMWDELTGAMYVNVSMNSINNSYAG